MLIPVDTCYHFLMDIISATVRGNPNLKLLCRRSVWLKSYGYFCALWNFFFNFSTDPIVLHTFQKKSSAFGPLPTKKIPYMVTEERPAGKTSELHFSFSQPFLCLKRLLSFSPGAAYPLAVLSTSLSPRTGILNASLSLLLSSKRVCDSCSTSTLSLDSGHNIYISKVPLLYDFLFRKFIRLRLLFKLMLFLFY